MAAMAPPRGLAATAAALLLLLPLIRPVAAWPGRPPSHRGHQEGQRRLSSGDCYTTTEVADTSAGDAVCDAESTAEAEAGTLDACAEDCGVKGASFFQYYSTSSRCKCFDSCPLTRDSSEVDLSKVYSLSVAACAESEQEQDICEPGGGGLMLPLLPNENGWSKPARAVIYFMGLCWAFLGVSIVADVFMGAIEAVTSKTKAHKLSNGKEIPLRIWNDTVANLTLMALGSSAPEILLSVMEILFADFYAGDLGPSTIVGSAAFNLLVILAVCVYVVPSSDKRTVARPLVLVVTTLASIFAYLWLVMIVGVSSPNLIQPWEGVLTFLFFPVLVVLAFLADQGKLGCGGRGGADAEGDAESGSSEKGEPGGDATIVRMFHRQQAFVSPAKRRQEVTLATQARQPNAIRKGLSIGFLSTEFTIQDNAEYIDLKVMKHHPGKSTADCAIAVEYTTENGGVIKEQSTIIIQKDSVYGEIHIPWQANDKGGDKEQTQERNFKARLVRACTMTKIVGHHDLEEADKLDFSELRREPGAKLVVIDADMREANVSVTDCKGTGKLKFHDEECCGKEHLPSTTKETECSFRILRVGGAAEAISCKFRTIPGSARPGHDYTELDEIIWFAEGVTSKEVKVKIDKRGKNEAKDNFSVEISGEHVDSKDTKCIVTIKEGDQNPDLGAKLARYMDRTFNVDAMKEGTSDWKDQISSAFHPGADGDDEEVTARDWMIHFVALPWKLFFALIPPTAYGGGWVTFCTALCFIGIVTAVIGDLAALLGCCMGLPDAVTAITIVALGTSLPDTFASKVAALEDEHADNAIGNVTGSNSVNVFLGLGLPWMIASIYWAVQGSMPDKWKSMYPQQFIDYPNGGFVVLAGDLVFSVLIFTLCAIVCLVVLAWRRRAFQAELGGPAGIKANTAILFVLLWVLYVSVASWKVFAGDVSEAEMIVAVLVGIACLLTLMFLILSILWAYQKWERARGKEHEHLVDAVANRLGGTTSVFGVRNVMAPMVSAGKASDARQALMAMKSHLDGLREVYNNLDLALASIETEETSVSGAAASASAEGSRKRKPKAQGRGGMPAISERTATAPGPHGSAVAPAAAEQRPAAPAASTAAAAAAAPAARASRTSIGSLPVDDAGGEINRDTE